MILINNTKMTTALIKTVESTFSLGDRTVCLQTVCLQDSLHAGHFAYKTVCLQACLMKACITVCVCNRQKINLYKKA